MRSCDGCTLCCKILAIRELEKPRGKLCIHATAGAGCSIYEKRPGVCAGYRCLYLDNEEVGEHWRPSLSNMLLNYVREENHLNVRVNMDYASVWRQDPYYADLKRWATNGRTVGLHVLVHERTTKLILPTKDVDLGTNPNDGSVAVVQRIRTPDGDDFTARFMTRAEIDEIKRRRAAKVNPAT